MARYISVTDTAKLVRAALKAGFPGVKFSVRSDSYSGGASIRVGWTDGPFEQDVATTVQRFRGADFDGMQDLKTNHDTLLATPEGVEVVHFGADYIFTERKLSDAYATELQAHAELVLDEYAGTHGQAFDANGWYEGIPTEHGIFQHGNGHNLLWFLSRSIAPGAAAPAPRQRVTTTPQSRGETLATYTPREAAETMAAFTAPAPRYFCDRVARVMRDEEETDPTVGMFLLAARGYLLLRDERPFGFQALEGYRTALRMLLAVDAGLPDAEEKINDTISEAFHYWQARGYR